jgi:hypothetical protein
MNIDVEKMERIRYLKKPELQELLSHYKLRKTGNKPQLFERLLDYYNEHPDVPIYIPRGKTHSGRLIIPQNKVTLETFSKAHCQNNIISSKNMIISEYINGNDCVSLIYIMENMKFSYPLRTIFHSNVAERIIKTYNHYKLKLNIKVKVSRGKFSSMSYETRRNLYELRHFFELLKLAEEHADKIVKIQRAYRLYILQRINKLRGPAYIKRQLCKNTEDFITYEPIKSMNSDLFYSMRDDNDSCIYGFNIESLIEYIHCYKCKRIVNPFNNRPMSYDTMQHIITTFNELKRAGFIKKKQLHKLSPENKMKDKAHHIFHRIDMLGSYTDVNWFLDLNIYQLKTLYKEAEDIWNYRAQHLTPEIKRKHIPNNDVFRYKYYQINAMTNRLKIQNIILDEFNKFVTEGDSDEECRTGALWMLTALVKVSPAQSQVMGWLVQ